MFYPILLTLAIIAGQIIKIPIGIQAGPVLLDIVIIFITIIGIFKSKFHLPKPPLFIIAGLVFLLIALLSLLASPLRLNLHDYLISFSYAARFGIYLLFGWLVYADKLPSIKKNIENILVLSALGLAVLGILQFVFIPDLSFLTSAGWDGHVYRTVSTFLDPNFLGAYFVLALIISAKNFYSSKKVTKRFLFSNLILYIAMITTFSRGTYIMFFVSGLILIVLNKSFKLFFISLVLFLGVIISYQTYLNLIAASRNIDKNQSAKYRIDSWQQGLKIFQDYPLMGVGYNSYKYALSEYHLVNAEFINSRGSSANDSSLLQVSATTGIIGLMSYSLFLLSLLFSGWKGYLVKDPWGYVLISSLLGLLAHSFFTNSLFYPFLFIWIILISIKTINDS